SLGAVGYLPWDCGSGTCARQRPNSVDATIMRATGPKHSTPTGGKADGAREASHSIEMLTSESS
ncbi:MAG: hypothetical protein ACFNLW_12430, partial [Olsenella sp.]